MHGAHGAEVEQLFSNLTLIAGALAAAGLLILAAGLRGGGEDADRTESTVTSLWIGAVQGVCIPFRGFSRRARRSRRPAAWHRKTTGGGIQLCPGLGPDSARDCRRIPPVACRPRGGSGIDRNRIAGRSGPARHGLQLSSRGWRRSDGCPAGWRPGGGTILGFTAWWRPRDFSPWPGRGIERNCPQSANESMDVLLPLTTRLAAGRDLTTAEVDEARRP